MTKIYGKFDFSSSFHLKFIKDSIDAVKSVLKKNWNANLNIYSGNTKEIFKALIDKFGVKEIYSHAVFRNKKIADIDRDLIKLFKCKKLSGKNIVNLELILMVEIQINGQFKEMHL